MNDDSLFSETEEELFNKIKRVYDSINRNLNEAGIKDDTISAFSIDETISLSDDGLSEVSDISSVASFKFSNVKKKKNEFRSPQIDKQKHRKSKIPVYDLQRKNRQISTPNSNNSKFISNARSNIRNKDNSYATPKRNQINNKTKINTKKSEQNIKDFESYNKKQTPSPNLNYPNSNNHINVYNYQEPLKPKNFLVPDLSIYSRVCTCIFEGRDFPLPSAGRGERSTYAVIQLHPDILPIQSPISFNKTKQAIYNGGFDINCSGLDFSSVTPIVSVYDYISEKERELIGVAFIELHLAKQFNNEMCIFMLDEWLDIFALNNRIKTGRVKMTLIFHTDEKDVSSFIKMKSKSKFEKNVNKRPVNNSKSNSSESDDDGDGEDKLIIKDEIIIGNEEDDVDFIIDDDESIKKANEKLKNEEKMKRNKSKKKAKLESLGVQAEPAFQNDFMSNFQNFSLNSSSSTPVKESKAKNPFNFNVNYNKNNNNDQINRNNSNGNQNSKNYISKDQNNNFIAEKKSNDKISNTNSNNASNCKTNVPYSNLNSEDKNYYINNQSKIKNSFDIGENISCKNNDSPTNFSDDDSDNDNKFNFTFAPPSFETNEIELENNQKEQRKNNEGIHYNDESIIGTDSLIPQKVPFSNLSDNENIEILDEKQLKFIDESMLATMGSMFSNEESNERSSSFEDENENHDTENENEKKIEKPNKRYTSYSDFHFMDEMK